MTDLTHAVWFKSSRSGPAGSCVEVAFLDQPPGTSGTGTSTGTGPGTVAVRDSKDPAGPALAFGADTWTRFLAAVRAGRLGAP